MTTEHDETNPWHPASEHPDVLTIVEGIAQDGTISPAIWTGSDWRCAKSGSPLAQWRWSDERILNRLPEG